MTDYDVWVDFNDIGRDGTTRTLSRFIADGGQLKPGEDVIGGDDEGCRCRGVVAGIDGEVVTIKLDLTTFSSPRSALQDRWVTPRD